MYSYTVGTIVLFGICWKHNFPSYHNYHRFIITSSVSMFHIQPEMFILKLITEHSKVVFIYFIKSTDILIIQQIEVLAKNFLLRQPFIVPVLPSWMDELLSWHFLSKELFFCLNILEVQDVVVGEGANWAVKRSRFPVFIITVWRSVDDRLDKLPPAGVGITSPASHYREGGAKIIPSNNQVMILFSWLVITYSFEKYSFPNFLIAFFLYCATIFLPYCL